MLQYKSPREPIHDIIYTQPRSLRARPTIYAASARRTRHSWFSLCRFWPRRRRRRSTNTTHTRFARGDHRAPPNGATSAPPCSAGVSSFVFRASVPCVLFRRAAYDDAGEQRRRRPAHQMRGCAPPWRASASLREPLTENALGRKSDYASSALQDLATDYMIRRRHTDFGFPCGLGRRHLTCSSSRRRSSIYLIS